MDLLSRGMVFSAVQRDGTPSAGGSEAHVVQHSESAGNETIRISGCPNNAVGHPPETFARTLISKKRDKQSQKNEFANRHSTTLKEILLTYSSLERDSCLRGKLERRKQWMKKSKFTSEDTMMLWE